MGEKLESTRLVRGSNHDAWTPGEIADVPGNSEEPDNHHGRLKEVGKGHRNHAAPDGVHQHDASTDQNALIDRNRAAGEDVSHQANGGQLGTGPADIAGCDCKARQHLYRFAVTFAIKVANREQVHPIEVLGKEQSHQQQTRACAERIGRDSAQPIASCRD